MAARAFHPTLIPASPRVDRPHRPVTTPERWQARLVESYRPLAERIARWVFSRYPKVLELDDLVGAAFLGLVDAARRFDPARGIAFEAFAGTRIRGAVLDALRAADWVPTHTRRQRTRLEQARSEVRSRTEGPSSAGEVARALDISLDAYDRLVAGAQLGETSSLEDLVEEGQAWGDRTAGSDVGQDEQLEHDRDLAALYAAIRQLPERERHVIEAYNLEERRLKDVALDLGVTESRVCQISRQAIGRLRDHLHAASLPH